ncbi:MAG: VOC family protein [Acidimicrobiia bacterium]
MGSRIALVTVVVADYDEAIAFYVGKAGFTLVEDTPQSATKRWVVVTPGEGNSGTGLLLAKADGDRQQGAVGNQTGGRVGFFLHTDDFARDHTRMTKAGVEFLEQPRHEPYGTVAVFRDLYGNTWDLLEPAR